MSEPKEVGDRTRFTATFRDLDGALFDGPVVLFKLRDPSGTETTYQFGMDAELEQESAGVYQIEIPWTAAGKWWRRWEVLAVDDDPTSTLVADERVVIVRPTNFATPILPA